MTGPAIWAVLFAAGLATGWTVNDWRQGASEAALMAATLADQAEQYRGEVERLRVRETDLAKLRAVIESIEVKSYAIVTPDCSDLGGEWLREYAAAVAAANIE